MSLSSREIDAVLGELSLTGSFLQNIRQPDFQHLLFDFHGRGGPFTLMVSLKPQALRLHAVTRKFTSVKSPPRFLQLLRARIKGGKVLSASQIGSERIIRWELSRGDLEYRLYIRLWGGAANLILTDGKGTILDAFSRRPTRNEIPGGRFEPEKLAETETEGTSGSRASESALLRDIPGEGSFNRRLELFYGEKEASTDRERLTARVAELLDRRERKIRALIGNLERKADASTEEAENRKWGDLLMAGLHRIAKGDLWFEMEDFENPGQNIRIPLDPKLTPAENAERFYKKRGRLETARRLADEELANARLELQQILSEREALLGGGASLEDLAAALPVQKEADSGEERFPGLRFRSGSHLILVGRTASENDQLLRRHVNGNDVWLHTRDYPGGYVFIKTLRGKSVPLEVLLDAGTLAVQYSKARQAGEAELYYTPVKYLRRAKEGPLGLVIPTREKNLSVRVDPERLKRLGGG